MALNDYENEIITPGEKKVRFIMKLVAYAFLAFLVYKCIVHVFNL
jgi:hypothetical protein